MKLNVKNFSSPNHRIVVKQNGIFINAFYHSLENGEEKVDKMFIITMEDEGRDYKSYLQELLRKVEKHYGIELIKTPLQIAV